MREAEEKTLQVETRKQANSGDNTSSSRFREKHQRVPNDLIQELECLLFHYAFALITRLVALLSSALLHFVLSGAMCIQAHEYVIIRNWENRNGNALQVST